MRCVRLVLLLLLLAPLTSLGQASSDARIETEHVRVDLLFASDDTDPDRFWAALHFRLIPRWHVYWRNPGDSGEAPRFDWRLPSGWRAGDIQWPVPERIAVGPLVNYGYSDEVIFLVPLQRTDSTAPDLAQISVDANWLVCEKECIPESATLGLSVGDTAADLNLREAQSRLPLPLPYAVGYELQNGTLHLRIANFDASRQQLADVWFAANAWGLAAPAGRQDWQVQGGELLITIPTGDLPPDGRTAFDGLLVTSGSSSTETLTQGFTLSAQPLATAGNAAEPMGLAVAIVLAFAGGLILNLMPCVLPVLAIKALSLTGHRHGSGSWRAGLSYLGGVVISVLILAGALLLLRAGGESLGWGFQLQSPLVVALLACLMLLVGLNLSGVFEVGSRLMSVGQERAHEHGAFATGVLAVLVASPCTAPFMGTALGYALTQSAVPALLVFAALGLGFALPMVMLSRWPSLLRKLPRAGNWMVKLKQSLAFPMYATSAWLLWVLAQQVDETGLARALAGLVTIALAAWVWGTIQGRMRWSAVLLTLSALAILPGTQSTVLSTADSREASTWSPQRLEGLRGENRPVLVNFTAAWCITCKVNERVAFASHTVRRAMAERNVVYLEADWTNRDSRIGNELRRFGRSGVPLYLLYRPDRPEPLILPQLLTEGIVLNALQSL